MILAPEVGQRVRTPSVYEDHACPDSIRGRSGVVVEALGMLATVQWKDGTRTKINGGYLLLDES